MLMDNQSVEKNIVAHFIDQAFNTKNFGAVLQLVHPGYRDYGAQAGDAGEAVMALKIIQNAFPDLSANIDVLFSEGQMVAFKGTFSGTHLGQYLGRAPTGNKVSFELIKLFRVENQRIVESWGHLPEQEILQQLKAAY